MTPKPSLAERIDDVLPQTQCTRCGYAGCRPYADAIAADAVAIDRCPPGGDATIAALARLLGRDAIPLDASRGAPGPRRIARIDEATCIGCTLCIQACPVDAIVGAPKRLHGVLSALCSGCELCLPPCPVDCIVSGSRGAIDDFTWRARPKTSARRVRSAKQTRRNRCAYVRSQSPPHSHARVRGGARPPRAANRSGEKRLDHERQEQHAPACARHGLRRRDPIEPRAPPGARSRLPGVVHRLLPRARTNPCARDRFSRHGDAEGIHRSCERHAVGWTLCCRCSAERINP